MEFTIIPAIDLLDGKVVRLVQGKFLETTFYGIAPVQVAERWVSEGARRLHVIDLDGARDGAPRNLEVIGEIAKQVDVPLEVGGGFRQESDIEVALKAGASYVILGTWACENPDVLPSLIQQFPGQLMVSIDAKYGRVATHGWTQESEVSAVDLTKRVSEIGIEGVVYTDIARDGTLSGPNVEALEAVAQCASVPVIASGGISSLDDVQSVHALNAVGVDGVIIGKALYESGLDLAQAIAACSAS